MYENEMISRMMVRTFWAIACTYTSLSHGTEYSTQGPYTRFLGLNLWDPGHCVLKRRYRAPCRACSFPKTSRPLLTTGLQSKPAHTVYPPVKSIVIVDEKMRSVSARPNGRLHFRIGRSPPVWKNPIGSTSVSQPLRRDHVTPPASL